jgi:DNA-binding CsgD family transcriptional regulator
MIDPPRDLLGIFEAAYAPARSDEEWLSGLLYAARPLLDRGLGVAAFFYDWAQPLERRLWTPLGAGLPRGALEALATVNARAPAELWRALVDPRPTCATLSARLGLGARITQNPIVREHLLPIGVADFLAVSAASPTGQGCVLGAPLPRPARVARREAFAWGRVAAHVAVGLRARRREGTARREPPSADPDAAGRTWRALLAGRWSLVDHFDHAGKRYVVARRNERGRCAPLNERERRVVELAVEGHSNRRIAEKLAISRSSVALHLGNAAAKLAASGRVALLRAYVAERGGEGGAL